MQQNRKFVALLPMKAHSERIVNKNFREIAGKPLFRWVLDILLSIRGIECVVINTDAREILAKYGLLETAKVIIRDRIPELCGDTVSMNLIIRNDIENIGAESYLMTHTTNPLLTKKTIQKAINTYNSALDAGSADSLFSVTKYQTRFYKKDGSPINHDPGNLLRTQDLEPWYEENSNLYLFNREGFLKGNARIGEKPVLFETPRSESIDIDDEEDFIIAEAVLRSRNKARN